MLDSMALGCRAASIHSPSSVACAAVLIAAACAATRTPRARTGAGGDFESEQMITQERVDAERLRAGLRELPPRDARRANLLLQLAKVCEAVGNRALEFVVARRHAGATPLDGERAAPNLARETARPVTTEVRRTDAVDAFECTRAALVEIERDFPDAPGSDRAYWTLGVLARRRGDISEQRRYALELIRRFPATRWRPDAYLLFADFFYEQGARREAGEFYERALSLGDARVEAYALVRLGLSVAAEYSPSAASAIVDRLIVAVRARRQPAVLREAITLVHTTSDADATRACDWQRAAVAMADQLGDPSIVRRERSRLAATTHCSAIL